MKNDLYKVIQEILREATTDIAGIDRDEALLVLTTIGNIAREALDNYKRTGEDK